MTDTNNEKLLTKETGVDDVNLNEKEEDSSDLKEFEDDFKGYTQKSKYLLFLYFFCMGIINHLGTILVMTGGRLLAHELGMKDYVQFYSMDSIIFAILTRFVNSKLCLKISYKKRIYFLGAWLMVGYLSMYVILELNDHSLEGYNKLCFGLSFIPCFFLGSSYAFGEAAMLSYLRLFPKTLIAGWSSGTGISGIISSLLNLSSQLSNDFSLKYLYLILFPVGIIYLVLFILSFRQLKQQEREIQKEEQKSKPNMAIIKKNDEDKEECDDDEDEKENYEKMEIQKPYEVPENEEAIKEEEDKEMEEMNKANQTMSWSNFKIVMRMAGRIIINLGLIYFLQFFCTTTLIVSVCDERDIEFLPFGCSDNGNPYRRGKYEFIIIFYQIGMFLSKTFIKIVRKIKPIEVYTITIGIINVIFIIEKLAMFMHWGVYIPLGLILGFLGGGTYAVGFYTILNSFRIKNNFKELTINIAAAFNDIGTLLANLIGWIFYYRVFNHNFPDLKDLHECNKANINQ